jgi:predicted transposase YdaD
MGNHDTGYKKLFSHPEMVEDLLRGFVKEDWVQELDFSTLTREFNSYVSEELRERHDDMVWRVRFRGRWLYLYLLLEFQSRPDPWMEKILIHSPFKKPQVQGAKKVQGRSVFIHT